MLIPGTDGQKMSKSYNNIIDIFLSEKTQKATMESKLILFYRKPKIRTDVMYLKSIAFI